MCSFYFSYPVLTCGLVYFSSTNLSLKLSANSQCTSSLPVQFKLMLTILSIKNLNIHKKVSQKKKKSQGKVFSQKRIRKKGGQFSKHH